jgi:hypothetical protein
LDDPLDFIFTKFVNTESDAQGVATCDSSDFDDEKPVVIDPKLFLNLLHKVLTSTLRKSQTWRLSKSSDADPYFGQKDYDMGSDDDDDDKEISDVLASMDLEL